MAVKEAIAIVADNEEKFLDITAKLALDKYMLLLVSKNADKLSSILMKIQKQFPGADVELIDCIKDGCWQADIIILNINEDEQNEVAALIREVATQKIVVSFSENLQAIEKLQKLLPHSKVVKLDGLFSGNTAITSNDTKATETVSNIFSIKKL